MLMAQSRTVEVARPAARANLAPEPNWPQKKRRKRTTAGRFIKKGKISCSTKTYSEIIYRARINREPGGRHGRRRLR